VIIGVILSVVLTVAFAIIVSCVEKFCRLRAELADLKLDYAKAIDGKLAAERELKAAKDKAVLFDLMTKEIPPWQE